MKKGALWILLSLWLVAPLQAKQIPLSEQRTIFAQARAALQSGDDKGFVRLSGQIRDYPLYPYLQYERLTRRLTRAKDTEVQAFLEAYADTPLAERLRRRWLKYAASRQQWKRFLNFYREPQPTTLRCYHLRALPHDPPDREWVREALDLWLVGHSQPDACDPVFEVLYEGGHITDELRWQRIRLAFAKGRTSLAGYIARELPDEDRKWVQIWRSAHRRPAAMLDDPALIRDHPIAREIIVHALTRLARSDASAARDRWLETRDRYRFSPTTRDALERRIALYAAVQKRPEALEWLAALPAAVRDTRVREWQARAALQQQDWRALLDAIDQLPPELQDEREWQYWRARALEKLDRRIEAMTILDGLSQQRAYHGFLAADYLDRPYALQTAPINYSEQELQALLTKEPGLARARELFFHGMNADGRREWAALMRRLDPRQRELAAVLAHRWGRPHEAIIAAARSSHRDDLEVRFPVLFQDTILKTADRFDLDPAWVFGILRQESAFHREARSRVGALGLMQLMPSTGRRTAKLLKQPRPSISQLLDVDRNIELGAGYLRHMLDRFDDNQVLATAAYNAGPHRVDRWLPADGVEAASVWVDTIPYKETRNYVRGVLAFTTVYQQRLGRPVTPLFKRMRPIGQAEASAAGS